MQKTNKARYVIDNSLKINILYVNEDDLKRKLDYLCNSIVIDYLKKCIRNNCRVEGYKVKEIKDLSLIGISPAPLTYRNFLFFWFRYVNPINGECKRISYCCHDTDFNEDVNNEKLNWRKIK